MKIYLGSDHAGYDLKEKVKSWLLEQGFEVEDSGAFSFDKKDDYNEYILKAARGAVVSENEDRCVIFGGSGQGEAIQANRVRGARAAVFYGGDIDIIKLSRSHNNSNILSLGARFLSEEEAKNAIDVWLKEDFSFDERHIRRNNKLDKI